MEVPQYSKAELELEDSVSSTLTLTELDVVRTQSVFIYHQIHRNQMEVPQYSKAELELEDSAFSTLTLTELDVVRTQVYVFIIKSILQIEIKRNFLSTAQLSWN